jgi:hypothetical protein
VAAPLTHAEPTAAARFVAALRESARVLRDDEPAVLEALLAHLARRPAASAAQLERRLVAFAAASPHAFVPLADLLGLAARGLAPAGEPPSDPAGADAWHATLATAERLYGGGVRRLGRLPFLDGDRLAGLLAESNRARKRTVAPGQRLAEPGPVLRELAVDRRLARAVSEAFGIPVEPAYRAVSVDYCPGALVEPHVDHADYETIVHLTLAHEPPADGRARAALVVFHPERPPARVELAPGEALTLRGRGSIHCRERLGPGEWWSTLAIGFRPAERRR